MAGTLHASRREQLVEERDRLVEQLGQMGHGPSGNLDFDDGFADSGQVTAERGEVDALAGSLQETLLEIKDALRKLDNGTYGSCERCDRSIAEARLEAMPAARLCIACASARR
jgi:DnaK suppressor protein